MRHPEYSADAYASWFTFPVRFRDLDPLNHVNNAIFSTMYEEARVDFIRKVPVFAEELEKDKSFVIVNICIDFIKQVTYPCDLLIGSAILETGNTSITSFQAIYKKEDNTLVSTAQATGVWFDLENGRPARLPEIPEIEDYLYNE